MSRPLAAGIASLLAVGWVGALAAQAPSIEIPDHPRQLRFSVTDWRPPSAAESRIALAGGATAFLVEDSTLPLVDVVVVAKAGANLERDGERGLAEMTATLLRRGGTQGLEPDAFDDRADELGALLSSQATKLYGAATLRVTSEVLDRGVELLLDLLEHPRFDAQRLAGIQRNLVAGMTRRNLDPLAVLDREWDWLLFGEDHYSTRALRRGDVEATTQSAMAAFHERHWRPENLIFAVAGDVDAQRLTRLLDPRLEAWAARLEATTASPWPPAPPDQAPRPGLFQVEADIPQAKVALGHRAPTELPTIEERVRIEVLAEILGGRGAISRLSGRLRSAEGLVYRIDARLDPGDLWPADYRIVFDTLDRNTPRALRAVLEEIDRLRSSEPHGEELAVVKRELVARQFDAFDTAEEAVGFLVQDWLVGRDPDYRARYRALVEAVTGRDVLLTARRHLEPERLTVLIVGRWSEVAGAVDASGLSEVERLLGRRVERLPERDPLTLLPR